MGLLIKLPVLFTGELKNLKFVKLSFGITGPGTIRVKWEEILKIRSDKTFQSTMRKVVVLVLN